MLDNIDFNAIGPLIKLPGEGPCIDGRTENEELKSTDDFLKLF